MIKTILVLIIICLSILSSCEKSANFYETTNPTTETLSTTESLSQLTTIFETTAVDSIERPEGTDFAEKFGDFFETERANFVQYWNPDKENVKFETSFDQVSKKYVLNINDNQTDLEFLWFGQVIVKNDIVVITTGGTDIRSTRLYIYDLSGKALIKVYYLNNKGMVIVSHITFDGHKITMSGDRISHGPTLKMENHIDIFPEYKDYIYQDTVYDYSKDPNIVINYEEVELFRPEVAKALNKDEIIDAEFELTYLGNGEFDKINMTHIVRTLNQYMEEQEKQNTNNN